jgi:hypothetical protein
VSCDAGSTVEGSVKVMIGEELVPGLPETRRPDQCPFGDAEAVAAVLVVSAVRGPVVRKYERAEGPVPAVVARVLGTVAGELGGGSGSGRCGCAAQRVARRRGALPAAVGPGPAGGVRVVVETPRLERTVPELREFGGHPLELGPERSKMPLRGDQLIGVGRVRGARREGRRNGAEPGCIAGVPVWMVLVTAGDGPLEGWDALDPLGEAVGAQPGTVEATVAGGDNPTVLVSVEATDVAAAREVAQGAVGAALEEITRPGSAVRFRRGRTGRIRAL